MEKELISERKRYLAENEAEAPPHIRINAVLRICRERRLKSAVKRRSDFYEKTE
jgi:hypothetical protein